MEGAVGYTHPVRGIKIPKGSGLAGRIMKTRQPMRTSQLGKLPGVHPIVAREGIVSYLGVPMVVGSEVSGVMVVGRRDSREYTDEDEHLLLLVADRVASSLDRERLLERATRLQHSAEELLRFKTDLLNMASHDLKTPLTAMLMQLQILELGEPLDETRQKAIQVLHRSTNRLRLMLDDMLDLARLESGTFVLRPGELDIAHAVRDACEIFGPKARNAGINFHEEVEEGLMVRADERRLAQVLANLLSNAVRATPKDGRISITAIRTRDRAEIVVEDSGRGMTKEQLNRLFKPFERVSNDSHRGTGLGLYLSRTIVEQHGGTMTVTSPGIGKGAKVRLLLPLFAEDAPPASPHAAPARPSSTK